MATSEKVILEGVVGSQAYGLATPDSDVDILGVFVAPTSQIVSLNPGKRTLSQHNPDSTHHEVSKFLELALKANPSTLELLWLDSYTVITPEGLALIGLRRKVLSRRVLHSYVGYARGQIDRLTKRQDGALPTDTGKRTAKHARHVARLLIQAEHLMLTGKLNVRLTESEARFCHSMGQMAVTETDEFLCLAKERIAFLCNSASVLPPQPDFEDVNELLIEFRRNNW